MSATIDVLIVFDCATILQNFPNPSQDSTTPTQVTPVGTQPVPIYMIVDQANVAAGQGGAELDINAQTGDTIRWWEASLSPMDYTAMLYAFVAQETNLISPPSPTLVTVQAPFPNPADPSSPSLQSQQDYFWNSVVENPTQPGQPAPYHFSFMILNREGALQGYFAWDPFLTITS